jgi:hypothetical protein
MIPDLQSIGGLWKVLPKGIHNTSLEEVAARFATDDHRKRLFEGFCLGVGALRRAGCKIVLLDGSFVTDKPKPNDYDACWDTASVDDTKLDPVLLDFSDNRKAQKQKYLGEFFPESSKADANKTFRDFFQIDKYTGQQKGILSIKLN